MLNQVYTTAGMSEVTFNNCDKRMARRFKPSVASDIPTLGLLLWEEAVKKIPLTRGYEAIVDDEDYDELMKRKWHYNLGYALRQVTRRKFMFMHGEIFGRKEGLEIDHINGDKLDNRRANLRHCTHSQNLQNQKLKVGYSSQYKGVHWVVRDKRWKSHITRNGKRYVLGYFKNEKEAALAYDEKAKELYGEFARCNFNQGCNDGDD